MTLIEQHRPETAPAPPDVAVDMPDPSVELCGDCVSAYRNGIEPGGTACEERARKATADRLEYLRAELRAERISYGDLAELQSLAKHIDPGDTELLEAAGVPEFPEEISDEDAGDALDEAITEQTGRHPADG